jgi:Polysaccharide lyase
MSKLKISLLLVGVIAGIYLSYGIGYAVYSCLAGPSLNFFSGFETGNLDEWTPAVSRQFCCEHSAEVVTSPVRSGKFAARLAISPNDPSIRGSKRAEFRTRATLNGKHYWYALSTYLPKPWEPSKHTVLLAQWHNVPDKIIGEGGAIPPLAMRTIDDQLVILSVSSEERVTTSWYDNKVDYNTTELYSEKIETDVWTDWLFHVLWSTGPDGIVQVWKNNEKIVDYAGPTAHPDFVAPYFKFGVYAPSWGKSDDPVLVDERVAVFDDVFTRESDGTLQEVQAALDAARKQR